MNERTNETYYEILRVQPTATTDEIKKSYRTLVLKYHPDKNLEDPETASNQFKLIQKAFDVLSDDQERSWYDRHKEAFHNDNSEDINYDISEIYCTSSCYSGFNDKETGFYGVYHKLFKDIIDQEVVFKPEAKEYQTFGKADTEIDQVKLFYAFWQSFSTSVTFSHLDKYDIRQAENRRHVRALEKENSKVRNEAKKERNTAIKNIVDFIRSKDKRMLKYRQILNEKNNENRLKSEEHRKKKILEQRKLHENYVEQEWSSMSNMEDSLRKIEEEAFDLFDKKKKKNKQNRLQKDECLDKDASDADVDRVDNNAHAESNVKEEDEDDEEIRYFCEACNKLFKTPNAFKNHEVSKKHKINAACLKRHEDDELQETEKEIDSLK